MNRILLVVVCLAILPAIRPVQAELVISQLMRADFEFAIADVAGNPLVDAAAADPEVEVETFVPFRARGVMTFTIDDSSTGASTLPFTNVTGVLQGESPGPFMPYVISPEVSFEGGSLTNVVWDGTSITSATVTDLSMNWFYQGTPAILQGAPARLNSPEPLAFSGEMDNGLFSIGSVISGPFFTGATNTGNNFDFGAAADLNGNGVFDTGEPVWVLGRNRTLTAVAVPEPGTFAVGLIVAAAVGYERRKRVAIA